MGKPQKLRNTEKIFSYILWFCVSVVANPSNSNFYWTLVIRRYPLTPLRHSVLLGFTTATLLAILLPFLCNAEDPSVGRELQRPKNIILVIGDGMGPSQMTFPLLFSKFEVGTAYHAKALEKLLKEARIGVMAPLPHNALVIDSACAITELASGEKALPETLGLNFIGEPVETVLERARDQGMSTALISDTRITHATPAGFVATLPSRNLENEIAEQILSSKVDLLLSGGLMHFVPKSFNSKLSEEYNRVKQLVPASIRLESKRKDELNLLNVAKENGYALSFDRFSLANARSRKILGLFADSGMVDGIAEFRALEDKSRTYPTLSEMTEKALAVLEEDPDGFFLMVEAGQIDWAGHANDAGTLLHEMLRLDRALNVIFKWLKNRNDTILLVTADHETGGFSFSYSAADIPPLSNFPGKMFQGKHFQPQYNFRSPQVLPRIASQKESLYSIAKRFAGPATGVNNAINLMHSLNNASEFHITLKQAEEMLTIEKNKYFREGHAKLSVHTWPKVNDFSAYYPDAVLRLTALIARALSEEQGIVWSTGTHTSMPVLVAAYGQTGREKDFDGFYETTEFGVRLNGLLGAQKN